MSTLLDRMQAHPEVRVKELGDGIVACNFTRRAFREGKWDGETTAARGLFLDERTSKVLARGYEKFFGIDEWQGHDLEDYLAAVSFPVTIAEKGNGYLGIMAVVRGRLTFYSKSGVSAYSEHFERMFTEHTSVAEREAITAALSEADATMLFEVIDPERDPHIVDYEGASLMILDVVSNTEKFIVLDAESFAQVFKNNPFFTRPQVTLAHDEDSLRSALAAALSSVDSEGIVARDANGFMVKVKSERYKAVKSMRGPLTRAMSGKVDQRAQKVLDRLSAEGLSLDDFLAEGVTGELTLDLPKIARFID